MLELEGQAASPGLAEGPVVEISRTIGEASGCGDPVAERNRLLDAIATARDQVKALMERSSDQSAAILDFQVAMLEDSELYGPVLKRLEAGEASAAAWRRAIDAQIADFAAAEDEYFRARTADLTDLRDRVLRNLAGAAEQAVPAAAILVGDDMTPTRFLEIDWSTGGAIALASGSPSSHVAMLARSRGVPMVTGLGYGNLSDHERAIVDGGSGSATFSPGNAELNVFRARLSAAAAEAAEAAEYLDRPAVTADGVAISVMINVADPAELAAYDPATCDGVGLMRTEFLFDRGDGLPDEETQYRAYRSVLDWAGERPVTIRTVDAGGDKPVPGLTVAESNPFLGLRGIRLSLKRPEIFRIQLRALARAALSGNLKVMLPMVTVPAEVDAARALFDTVVDDLTRAGTEAVRPPLGIMVEVPAVAIAPDLFRSAAFFSIGSNDLTQYVTAAARDSVAVAALNNSTHPAVHRLSASVAAYGRENGIGVSLCGDAGSDPGQIPALVAGGLRALSVAPAALARTKQAIATARADRGDG